MLFDSCSKALDHPDFLPFSVYYEAKGIEIQIGHNKTFNRFSLKLDDKLYFELDKHLSGQINLNGKPFLEKRMQWNRENFIIARKRAIGHS